MGWPADIFELRTEVQHLVLDVLIETPCTCVDRLRAAEVRGDLTPTACLACRAAQVLVLARRLMGNTWVPLIGVAHRAAAHIACIEIRIGSRGRVGMLRPIEGRQRCEDCGTVLHIGPHPKFDAGQLVALYGPAEDIPRGIVRAQHVRLIKSTAEPGVIACADLAVSRIRILADTVESSAHASVRRTAPGFDARSA